MGDTNEECEITDTRPIDYWLSCAQELVPLALDKSRTIKVFIRRWKIIISKLERIPNCLSDLSSHPCFSKNSLCKEQLQAMSKTLRETLELADRCEGEQYVGKLQMQSDLDSLSAKLELNLRDCGFLIKTGVLGESVLPLAIARETETEATRLRIRELLVRVQMGHLEAKHRALNSLEEITRVDGKNLLAVLGRNNISALVQLLSATSIGIREKAAMLICTILESGGFDNIFVSEGVIPLLIRLVESGNQLGKEKAMISLQRLSMTADTACLIASHSGIRPLIEICQIGEPVSQAAAAGTLKNMLVVPELRQNLAEEGIVEVVIYLLDCGILLSTKEYVSECLQNLTSSNEELRRAVVSEGGIKSLLSYLDGPYPHESAVSALRNLVGSVSVDNLVSLGVLPRLVHVLNVGSSAAQQAAASTICRICNSAEMKRWVGETGCIPLLIKMLEAKTNSSREIAAQALCSLLSSPQNCREVKKDETVVPNLVQLLEPSPQNSAKKYAISCLVILSSSKKCKKLMISYGAIGYLKKLCDMDVPGAKKLFEQLETGKTRSLFGRK